MDIRNYLRYMKDVTFEESPFNDVDNLILSLIVYLDFKDIVTKAITIKDAGKKMLDNYDYEAIKSGPIVIKKTIENFEILYSGKRYKDIILSNYEKIVDNEKQFCAMTYHLKDGTIYIAYEGTDDSIIGWKEDFDLIYEFPIPSQTLAINYINKIVKFSNKKVLVGGHSKGGNLAMTASMYAKPFIKRRIKTVYNNDGPGFRKQQFESKEFKEMSKKLKMFVPSECVIGFILRHIDNYYVIKSGEKGIMQHNGNNWNCYGPIFIKGTLTKESEDLEKRVLNWLNKHDDKTRKQFVDALFDTLAKADITYVNQMKQFNLTRLSKFIKASKELDKESKELVLSAIKVIFIEKGFKEM